MDSRERHPIVIEAEVGQASAASTQARAAILMASALHYNWFHYGEAGAADANLASVDNQGRRHSQRRR